MQKILFVLTLVLALSACVFADTIIYQEDFSTGMGGWEKVFWDEANERVVNKSSSHTYYEPENLFTLNENWVISYDLTVLNTLTDFVPNRATPSFYFYSVDEQYELHFTNASITETVIDSDYTKYSYIVDAGENRSGLAAGYYSYTTYDIDELLNQSYETFYLNWYVDDEFRAIGIYDSAGKIYIDNVKIMERSNVVPEPMTVASVAMGLASIAGVRRFKK